MRSSSVLDLLMKLNMLMIPAQSILMGFTVNVLYIRFHTSDADLVMADGLI